MLTKLQIYHGIQKSIRLGELEILLLWAEESHRAPDLDDDAGLQYRQVNL